MSAAWRRRVTRLLTGSFLTLVLVILVLVIAQRVAAERVEVVELHTLDSGGESHTTRLWIVDDEGLPYLRVGSGSSGWSDRLLSRPTFELTRGGERAVYAAVPRAEKRDRINALMRDKYTWGDRLIDLMVGYEKAAIPLELHRIE